MRETCLLVVGSLMVNAGCRTFFGKLFKKQKELKVEIKQDIFLEMFLEM